MAPRSAPLVNRYGVRAVGVAGMLLNAIAIGGYAFIGTSSPIWIVAALYFVQGAGLGVAIPAATASVMQALPRERAGAGSALSNTARQVAVALSVAVLGSILAQAYRTSLSPTLSRLPESARNAAGTSITATQALAQHLGPAGRFLLAPADASFVDAMRVTTAIAAGLAVIGAIAVSRWMPGKPRPTIEEIEEIVAREIAAAERDLALIARPRPSEEENSTTSYLERTVASPGTAGESLDG
jgi:MFS family permease